MQAADYEEPQIEWINWHQVMRLLKAAEVGLSPWDTLIEWCGNGHIDTKVATLTVAGHVKKDQALEPVVWRICQTREGTVDPMVGAIKFSVRISEAEEPVVAHAFGPQFGRDQVLALLPPLPDQALRNALEEEGEWLGHKRKPEVLPIEAIPSSSTRRGGNPGKVERWHQFYLTVLQWHDEGKLQTFGTQAELRSALLRELAFDEDGGLSDESIRGPVSNIWHKVLRK